MKKRVLFAVKNMNIGGVEKALLSLLGTIPQLEYEVDLLLLEEYGGFMEQIPSWVNVIVLKEYADIRDEVNLPPVKVIGQHLRHGRFGRAVSLGVAYALSKLTGDTSHYYRAVFRSVPALDKAYDIAVSYTSIINYLTWYVMHKVWAEKRIGWIHFDISKLTIDHAFMEKLHSEMDKIYVVSTQAYEAFMAEFPNLAEKCEVRYNVVDAEMIRSMAQEPAESIREEGVRTIVTLGRLSAEKGQDMVPAVAQRLREAGISFRWYLIGDGNLRPGLEKAIRENGLEDTVILLGTKANPYPYLKQADIYVQTSVYEGFCITLAEAKVFDLPIIATDFAGAHEQLDGRANCCVIKRDAEEMARAISNVMRM